MGEERKKLTEEEVIEIFNEVRKQTLLYAQASLSQSQFEAFRKLVLDLFGRSGAEQRVSNLFKNRNGVGVKGN